MSELDTGVERAAEAEDYDLAEDLQKELELYQEEEGPKVEAAKKQLQVLAAKGEVSEALSV